VTPLAPRRDRAADVALVGIILDAGGPAAMPYKDGRTALENANDSASRIVDLLARHGANVTAASPTAAHRSSWRPSSKVRGRD
jgi:hypothetical protein